MRKMDEVIDKYPSRWILVCGLLLLTLACEGSKERVSDTQSVIDWASEHLVAIDRLDAPLSDEGLAALREVIGAARVVGLGESRHDTREQLLLKGVLLRHMVEDLGFRVLILEESFPHAESLDRYVTQGEGDLRSVMNGLAGWYLWDTEEMLELVQWIRRHNEDREADQQVHIFGMDITAPAPGVRQVVDFLAAAQIDIQQDDEALGLDLQRGDFWPTTWERYGALSAEHRAALKESYDRLTMTLRAHRLELIASSSEQRYERIERLAEIGSQGNALFSSASREEGGVIREGGMAETALWVLDRELAKGKAIVWAHNLHIATSSFRMAGLGEGTFMPMGVQLKEALGDAYIAVGAAFGSGSYPAGLPPGERIFEVASEEVMDGALARVEMPYFFVDLRGAEEDAAVADWLHQEREWKAQDFVAVLTPKRAFDLVVFVEEISRSQPTPLALQRFQSSAE
jgi:erythromycin esterase